MYSPTTVKNSFHGTLIAVDVGLISTVNNTNSDTFVIGKCAFTILIPKKPVYEEISDIVYDRIVRVISVLKVIQKQPNSEIILTVVNSQIVIIYSNT